MGPAPETAVADDLAFLRDWAVELRVWARRAGQAVLGPGRLELLEWIERCQSISAAARQLGISYRHAWVLVQEINHAAGEPLVEAATGGRRGGGARLTTRGRLVTTAFRDLEDRLRDAAAGILPGVLSGLRTDCVHVAAAVSLEQVLGQLFTDYALLRPEVQVRAIFGASDELANLLLAGAPTDLFLTAGPMPLVRLAELGLVDANRATPLAVNTLAAIGPVDRVLHVRRPRDLLSTTVQRVALAVASCPLGEYSRTFLKRQGLYDALVPRTVFVDHSQAVVAAVSSGQADVGLVYHSAVATSGCRVLFRARGPQAAVCYAGAVVRRSPRVPQAVHLLEFLSSARARRRFRRCGFLPPSGPRE